MATYKTTYKRYNGTSWDAFYFTPAPHTHTLMDLSGADVTKEELYTASGTYTFSSTTYPYLFTVYKSTEIPIYKNPIEYFHDNVPYYAQLSLKDYTMHVTQSLDLGDQQSIRKIFDLSLNHYIYDVDSGTYKEVNGNRQQGVVFVDDAYKKSTNTGNTHFGSVIIYAGRNTTAYNTAYYGSLYNGVAVNDGNVSIGSHYAIPRQSSVASYYGTLYYQHSDAVSAYIPTLDNGFPIMFYRSRLLYKGSMYIWSSYSLYSASMSISSNSGAQDLPMSSFRNSNKMLENYPITIKLGFALTRGTSANNSELYDAVSYKFPYNSSYSAPQSLYTIATVEDVNDAIDLAINNIPADTYKLNIIDLNTEAGTLPLGGGSIELANGMTLNLTDDAQGNGDDLDVTLSISVDEYIEDGGGIWYVLVDEDDTMLMNSVASIYNDRNLDYMMNNGSEATGYHIKVFGCADTSDYMVTNKNGNGFDLDNLYEGVILLATITYDIDEQVWRIAS